MPDPVTGILAGGSVIGSSMQADAAGEAASAQSASAQAGIDEQRRQFDAIRELLKPYVDVGVPALQAQRELIGLGGDQQAAINRLEQSPLFRAQVNQGEQALLQRASATGGLRGGNIQAALAQFRPQMLNAEIERQYGRLGGLTSLGQQSAVGVGTAGQAMGSNIANLLQQQGAAQAGGALGQGAAYSNMIGGIAGGIGRGMGGGIGGGMSDLQAGFSQTPIGSSGFGTGLAYGNQDLGLYF